MIAQQADRLTQTPAEALDAALGAIESASIRAWAGSERNRPIWEAHVARCMVAGADVGPLRLSTFIVLTALG